MDFVPCKCKNKCKENATVEDRQLCYDKYWSMPEVPQRKQFLLDHLSRKVPMRRTTNIPENSRKQFTIEYFIDTLKHGEHKRIEVCRKVFLSTFQCGEKTLRNLLSKNEIGGIVKPDMRGGRNPGLLMNEEKKKRAIIHLNSFPKVESHYTRKSSKKLYIEDTSNFGRLTISRMHELYK